MQDFAALRAMVVGQNRHERRLIIDLVRSLGFGAIDPQDEAVQAFAQASRRAPDVLIVDAEMRPHTGLGFAREVRAASGPLRRVPILLHTAEWSRAFVEAAEQAGIDEALARPVSRGELETALRRALLGGRRAPLADRFEAIADARGGAPSLRAGGLPRDARLAPPVRAAIAAAVAEARAADGREAVRRALARAAKAAEGADPVTRRAIAGALRAARAEPPDPELLVLALDGVQALIASLERPAMREAVADALIAAASRRRRAAS